MKQHDVTTTSAILIVGSLVSPLLLIPIEKALPYPYLIEELLKALSIIYLKHSTIRQRKMQLGLVLLISLFFALSETMLYLVNIFSVGRLSDLPTRAFYTTAMHIVTWLTIYFGFTIKHLALLSLLIAITVHYFFNISVSPFVGLGF